MINNIKISYEVNFGSSHMVVLETESDEMVIGGGKTRYGAIAQAIRNTEKILIQLNKEYAKEVKQRQSQPKEESLHNQ